MRITKYYQSTLLIEANNKRILIDPSTINYSDTLVNDEWINIDIILITHKHMDHCNKEAIDLIINRDKSKLYTTKEVVDTYSLFNSNIVKEEDIISYEDIRVEVTKAVHGYLTGMKEANNEVLENVGFIIDDGTTRVYITSDTINFYNEYKCDVLCMPFNGNGLTLGMLDGLGFIKGINPKLVLPIHRHHPNPIMNPEKGKLADFLNENGIDNIILEYKEKVTV